MLFPCGNFLIIGLKFNSIIPSKFKPIIKIKEAKNKIKYAPPIEVKTFPLIAQIIPIIAIIIDKPKTKEDNWIKVFNLSLSP